MAKLDALTPAEKLEKTIVFARQHYDNKKTVTGRNLLEHCVNVARQAEVIAAKLYQNVRADFLPDNAKESISNIMQAAILQDVLNVSDCAFEHIAETATVQIAAMVADISRDFRLVETKRDMEFRGRLSQSPVGSQIVVAADALCTCKDLDHFLDAQGLAVSGKIKKILAQLDGDLLAIHAANRYYVLRMYVHAARNLLLDTGQKIKKQKHQAKIDKIVEKNTRQLREKVNAAVEINSDVETDSVIDSPNTSKKRGRRGKKRVV